MNIDNNGPIGLWLTEQKKIDPMKERLEMALSRGFEIIVPKFIMPQFELDPLVGTDFGFGYPIKANVKRFRSIIRKAKQKQ